MQKWRWKYSKSKTVVGAILLLLLLIYMFCLPRRLFDVPHSTVVTDRHGELLGARIATDEQWRFPERKDVPERMRECIVEFEDRAFGYHWGVNPVAIVRASRQNLREGRVVSGGSTITMQTIRLSRNKPRTFGEKIVEMVLATRLEFRYSKRRILAMYMSNAPFGGNVVGVDAAAWRFFGRSADQLSWAESAMLAVLPNSPAVIHLAKNRDKLLLKRNRLLSRLHDKGVIDDSTYELAVAEPLPDAPYPLPSIAPHLVSYFAKERDGQCIVSTIDKPVQQRVESLVERWNAQFAQGDIRNMAVLVVDLHRNEVAAYCGNIHTDGRGAGNQVDVVRAPRSTGSILKPFLYYCALEEGMLIPHTLLPDVPLNVNGFAPQNFSMRFEGAVPAAEAMARSLNIPSVVMLQRYGVPKFHTFLRRAGLSTITKPSSHYGLSLILGGAEATLWDVTRVYADMGRCLGGLRRTECSLLAADSVRGYLPELYKPEVVWQTFDAIKEVNRPEEIDWHSVPSMQTVAWKTGTSYGFRDAWAVGVTPRYAVGVWVGNATGEGRPGLVGARTAAPVMFDVFNLLPSSRWFDRPNSDALVEVEVCAQSGHIAGRFCDERRTELIYESGLRSESCPYHRPITLSSDEKFRVYENQADDQPVRRNWFVLPPVWEWYYKQYHPEYRSLPPLRHGAGDDSYSVMQFIYPTPNARIVLPRQMDGRQGEMTFELAHSDRRATVFWHLDGEYLTCTEDFHKVTLAPSVGHHRMVAVDGVGNTISVGFRVE